MNDILQDHLENLSVRISTAKKNVGSGFVVYPEQGTTMYILTARHCVQNIPNDQAIFVEFYNYEQNGFWLSISVSDRFYFEAEIDYDIAILPISKEAVSFRPLTCRLLTSIPKNQEYDFRGFPNGLQGKKPVDNNVIAKITIGLSAQLRNLGVRPENHETDAMANTKGFSGSGIVQQKQGQLYLSGIITHYDSIFNDFRAYNLSKINELLKLNNHSPLGFDNHPEAVVKKENNESLFIHQNRESLKQAEELWKGFRPQEAFILVESVRQNVEDSSLKSEDRDTLLAKACYLKALIESDLGTEGNTNALFIEAYNLHKEKKEYQERAAVAYLQKDNKEKAYEIAEGILTEDEENIRGWVTMSKLRSDLPIPAQVKASPIFKVGQIAKLAKNDNRVSIEELVPIFSDELKKQSMPDVLDRTNIYYWNYVAQTAMHHAFQREGRFIHLQKPDEFEDDILLKYAFELFKSICDRVHGTEFQEQEIFRVARFDYCICHYYLVNDPIKEKQLADDIFRFFIGEQTHTEASFIKWREPVIDLISERLCEVLIICLQQQKSQLVISALTKVPSYGRAEIQMLLGKAYSMLNQTTEAIEAYKQYLNSVDEKIDQLTAATFLDVIQYLMIAGQSSDIIVSWVVGEKIFTDSYIKPLLEAFCQSNNFNKRDIVKEAADKVKPYWNELEPGLKKALTAIYSDLKEYNTAKELFRELIGEGDKETDSLKMYLLTLYNEHVEFEELASRLAYWREHFSPDFILTSCEATLYRKLNKYTELAKVSLYGMLHFPDSPAFWVDRIRSLHRLRYVEDLLPLLDDRILTLKLPAALRMSIAHIYLTHDRLDLGQEACYQAVKEEWANPNIKMAYFSLSAQYKAIAEKELPETVEEGMVVRLRIDGKHQLLEMTPQNLLHNSVAKRVMGLHVNDFFQLNEKISDKPLTYIVDQILDKYQGLFALIENEVKTKLHGMPIQSVEIPSGEGSEGILNQMNEAFGTQETKRYLMNKESQRDFANHKIGFMELTQRVFGGSPLATWEYVTSDYAAGFPIIPLVAHKKLQPSLEVNQETEFVLDFSSLLTLYHLSQKGVFNSIRKPFIVSQYIVDYIGFELEQSEHEQSSSMSLRFQGDRYTPYFHPDDLQERQIKFWTGLYEWIQCNCRTDYAWERLGWEWEKPEDSSKLLFSDEKMYESGFWDTLLLANRSNRLLITDDLYLFIKLPGNFVAPATTEWYLRTMHLNQYQSVLWLELIRLNMRGLTLSGKQLYQTFSNSKLATQAPSDYLKAIHSLSLRYNPNVNNLFEAVVFLKNMYAGNLLLDYKRQLSRTLFQVVLKDHKPFKEDTLSLLLIHIDIEFQLLGNYSNLVKEDLYYSLEILSNSSVGKPIGLT